MHKIKLECLALAKPFAQNLDELFNYGDKIQNYIFDATTNDVRRVFYVDVDDILPEEAEAKLKKVMSYSTSRDAIVTGETSSTDEIPVWMPSAYRIKKTVEAATEDFASRANAELAPVETSSTLKLLRDIDDSVLHDAIISEPVVPSADLREELHFKNYSMRGVDGSFTLRPILQHAAQMFVDGHDVVLNVARNIGTSNLIAALARHYMVRNAPQPVEFKETYLHKVLVLTNTNSARAQLTGLIDDATVDVMTFAEAAKAAPQKGYSIVLFDNAAFIPYASENTIMSFISASGMPDEEGNLIPPRIFMASVPGQEMGLFHSWFAMGDDDHIMRLTISWKDAGIMDSKRALKFRHEIGALSFDNQYCNKFRPVE